ncbi:pyridoxamine 5'-phosphate oxidase family protein [Streptomyces sp. NPDC047079]|uniref:pyridoxamine 5'-phosphate oxidase family protein n=1 Tax=Streptomyces sp. NPDC047079 TaxID=3154607 RepID=UPI0033F436F0
MTQPPPLPATLPLTEPTRRRRLSDQDSLRRAGLQAILDAGFVRHPGVVVDGRPLVVPTVYGRDERQLHLHGSVAGRSLAGGAPVCVTVTGRTRSWARGPVCRRSPRRGPRPCRTPGCPRTSPYRSTSRGAGDPVRLTRGRGHTVRSRTPEPGGDTGWAAAPHWSRI